MHLARSILKVLAVAACSAPLLAIAEPKYTVTVVGDAGSFSYGLNNAGDVVGYVAAGTNQHAFVYSGGMLADLGTFGGDNSAARGINDAGQVVGYAENGAGVQRAFSYFGGVMGDLGTLGGASAMATAINNAGQIVGSARTAAEEPRAFLLSGGVMQNLGTLPSSGEFYSYAWAINEHGKIAGSSSAGEFTPPEPPVHAFLRCCNGTLLDLGTFGGQFSEATGINDKGEVVGIAATEELHFDNVFLYSNGVMHDLGTLPGDEYASAYDINNLSQVVGTSYGGGGGFLYEGAGLVDLDTLIDPAEGWSIVDAHAINDMQQIAGTACKAGECFAVRLDLVSMVPEPASYGLMAAGLALLGARRRKPAA